MELYILNIIRLAIYTLALISFSGYSNAQVLVYPEKDYYIEYNSTKQITTGRILEKLQKSFVGDTGYLFTTYSSNNKSMDRITSYDRVQLIFTDSSYFIFPNDNSQGKTQNQKYEKERFYDPFKQIIKFINIYNSKDTNEYIISQNRIDNDSVFIELSLRKDTSESNLKNQMRVLFATAIFKFHKNYPLMLYYSFEVGTDFGNQKDEIKITKLDTQQTSIIKQKQILKKRFDDQNKVSHLFRIKDKGQMNLAALSLIPDSTYRTLLGSTLKITDLKAEYYIVDFWYAECLPCIICFPALERLSEKYKSKKVQFIGINPKDFPNKTMYAKKMVEKYKIDYPTLIVNDSFCQLFKITSFPTILILDKNLNIIKTHIGSSADFEQRLDTEIKEVLGN